MPKNVRIYRTLGGLIFFLIVVLHIGCSSKANPQDEIAITTNSDEARKLFLEGRELFDDIRFDEARDLFQKRLKQIRILLWLI